MKIPNDDILGEATFGQKRQHESCDGNLYDMTPGNSSTPLHLHATQININYRQTFFHHVLRNSTRKQKAKETRSGQSDVLSDLEDINFMLGDFGAL